MLKPNSLTSDIVAGTILNCWPEFKSNLLLDLQYYAEACNKFAEPTSASLGTDNTALYKKMPQQWQAVDNIVSDLTVFASGARDAYCNVCVLPFFRLFLFVVNEPNSEMQ